MKGNRVTILGLGNILLGDEGFGVHFIRWFANRHTLPPEVAVVDGGTLGYRLLDVVTECEHLIVIDVIRVNDRPGSLYRFTKEEMELHMPPPTSAHEVEFFDVLVKAELMGTEPETVFLCIVPEKYGTMDLEMTPLMNGRFHAMNELLLSELKKKLITPDVSADA